jgi:hypothetical protein
MGVSIKPLLAPRAIIFSPARARECSRVVFRLFLDGGLAFIVALGCRSRECESFREWWWTEGVMIWLAAASTFALMLLLLP